MVTFLQVLALITAILPAVISGRWYWKREGSRAEHVALSLITLVIVDSAIALILGLTGMLTVEGILLATGVVDSAMFLFGESKNL